MDTVILVICAVISDADGWEAIERFGKEKLKWLRRFAPFANGVPSHDCIASVVSRLSVVEDFFTVAQSGGFAGAKHGFFEEADKVMT